jgi:outer membrane lipoprotein-sorting protein
MRRALLIFTLFWGCMTVLAQDTPNARQAKRVFSTAWNHIYNSAEGVRFHYKINILGLYKEEGTSWNKGDLSRSEHKNSIHYSDGKLKHIVRTNKKIVELHDPRVNKADEKLQMFKFDSDSYNYSIAKDPEGLLVTLVAKPKTNVKMKRIEALLTSGNYYPKRLRIKVSIFWATITFTDFQTGDIDDGVFVFPKEKYKDYKVVDLR